jgi:4-hydroxy-tetrahydrodipicolinate synthase
MLRGSIVALVTPMHPDGSLDFASLGRLIDWHCAQGTVAIGIAATTGESPTLDPIEHIDLIAKAVELAAGRVPVVAGIGANSTTEALHLAREAQRVGAQSGLAVVPYYNKPTQEGIYRHFCEVADRTGFPQILYNIPGRTAVDMQNETIALLARHPSIIGLKDATSNMGRALELMTSVKPDFAFYAGDDEITLPYVLMGGHGVISVAANIVPRLMSDLCRYALEGNLLEARKLNARLLPAFKAQGIETNPIPIKFAMARLGLIEQGIRPPLTHLQEKFHATVSGAFDPLTS